MKAVAEPAPLGTFGEAAPPRQSVAGLATRNRSVLIGAAVLAIVVLIGLLAPYLGTVDPAEIDPAARNLRPGGESNARNADGTQTRQVHWMGTDTLGRDVYSRVL